MIAEVPYDAKIEYLQSTGTQYINTLVTLDSGDVVTLKGSPSNRNSFFGVFRSDGTSFNLTGSGSNSLLRFGGGNRSVATTIDTAYTFVCGLDFKVNGSPIGSTASYSFTGASDCVLFARNGGVNPTLTLANYLRGKIYWLKIEKAGVLVRDFIPVRVGSVGYMYDRVTRRLFGNQGTGAFVLGPDVAKPVMSLHMFRKPQYTARDYVQDGLIAMWDGIENAGWGVHDANATIWKDLVGNGYDATLGRYCSFSDNYCATDGGSASVSYATARTEQWIDDIVHMEAVGSSPDVTKNVCFVGCNVTHTNGTSNNIKGIGIGATDCIWTGKVNNGKTGFGGYTLVNDKIYSISSGWASSGAVYVNGEALTKNNTTAAYYNAGGSLTIFSTGYTEYGVNPMKVFSIRIYSRSLTATEIAHNYNIDKLRFNLSN